MIEPNFFEIILTVVTTAGIVLYIRQSAILNIIQEQLKLILSALDTDIRNNIDLEKQLTDYLLDHVKLNSAIYHEWVMITYLQSKRDCVIRGYKDIKENIQLLNSIEYQTQFLGNGEAELRHKCNYLPEPFLKSVNNINTRTFKNFKYSLLMQNVINDIHNRDYFTLKLAVIKAFKENVAAVMKSYNATIHLIDPDDINQHIDYNLVYQHILDNLDDLNATLNDLRSIKQESIPDHYKKTYIMLLADITSFLNSRQTYTFEQLEIKSHELRSMIVDFITNLN